MDQPGASSEDPYDWSVDDVVYNFCKSRDLWNDKPHSALPDPIAFETFLRENDINGSTLLKDVDKDALQRDANIKSLGQRASIHNAIKDLRRRSEKILSEDRTDAQRQQSVLTGISGIIQGVRSEHDSVLGRMSQAPSVVPETKDALNPKPKPSDQHEALRQYLTSQQAVATGVEDGLVTLDTRIRQGEALVEDKSGRKRRKLAHGFVTTIPPKPVTPSVNRHTSFLGRKKLAVEELFFGSTKLGKEVVFDGPFLSNNAFTAPTLPDFGINLYSQIPRPEGKQRFVNRRMLHFFRSAERQNIVRHGRSALVLYPYQGHVRSQPGNRSALLFDPKIDFVTREDPLFMNTGYSVPDDPVPETEFLGDEYNFLLEKWRNKRHGTDDPDEFPAYGESDRNAGYDSEEERELEDEKAEIEAERHLTKDRAGEVFDETMFGYVEAWKQKKLPLREHKAWSIWRNDTTKLARADRIAIAKKEVRLFTDRLEKQKAWLLLSEWKKEEELVRSCLNSQPTIEQREEELFKIEVLKRRQAPEKPDAPLRVQKKKPVPANDGDGMSLDSDSDVVGDSLEGFIENDEVDGPGRSQTPDGAIPEDTVTGTELPEDHPISSPPTISPPSNENDDLAAASPLSGASEMDIDDGSKVKEEPDGKHTETPPAGHNIVDLTQGLSDSSSPAKTNESMALSTRPSALPSRQQTETQATGDADDALTSEWIYLEERNDRKRLLLKLLLTLPPDQFAVMRNRFASIQADDFNDEIYRALQATQRGEKKIMGLDMQASSTMFAFARLFSVFDQAYHELWEDIPKEILQTLLDNYLIKKSISQCYGHLKDIFNQHLEPAAPISAKLVDPNTGESDESPDEFESDDEEADDDEDKEEVDQIMHGRKKLVPMSTEAIKKREKALARMNAGPSQLYTQRYVESQSQGIHDEDSPGAVVNIDEEDENQFIFIDHALSSRMQSHQLDGVRFMWREVISGKEGCLLAHTMGLGKTMQAIAFLHTLAVAASDDQVSKQLPAPLRARVSKTLIICPPALVNNWREEFVKWLPAGLMGVLGKVFYIDSSITDPRHRFLQAKSWKKESGIMIIGYEMFRAIVDDRAESKGKASKLPIKDSKDFAEILLTGPDLIIADEAHRLKGINTRLGIAAARLKSTYRIALTGSPLANHLLEYFAMIDWVAPGFLGPAAEFKARYKVPIEEGLFKNSTPATYRKALKRLHILNREIAPKINRANIEVLRGSLKPKVEFVLKVGLTAIQTELYSAIIRTALEDGEMSNTNLWKWMGLLQLACNHPMTIQEKLNDPAPRTKKRKTKAKKAEPVKAPDPDDETKDEDEAVPDFNEVLNEAPIQDLIPARLVEELRKILVKISENIIRAEHASKALIAMSVITNAREVGDRVLVFSQSILTLNYLETFLRKRKIKSVRLDGSTHTSKRQGMAKDFNDGKFDVFLISTTAGGVGLNLPGANRVVIMDFGFNPTHEEQAVGRSYRLGQGRAVFVYRFVSAGTFEEPMYNKAIFKTQLAFRVVEKRTKIKSQAIKSSDYLFEPRAMDPEDLDEHKGKDTEVLDKILAAAEAVRDSVPIKAITTTETLQTEFADEALTAEEEQEVERTYQEEKLRKEYGQNLLPTGPTVISPSTVQVGMNRQPPEAEQTQKIHIVTSLIPSAPRVMVIEALRRCQWRTESAIPWVTTYLSVPAGSPGGPTASVPQNAPTFGPGLSTQLNQLNYFAPTAQMTAPSDANGNIPPLVSGPIDSMAALMPPPSVRRMQSPTKSPTKSSDNPAVQTSNASNTTLEPPSSSQKGSFFGRPASSTPAAESEKQSSRSSSPTKAAPKLPNIHPTRAVDLSAEALSLNNSAAHQERRLESPIHLTEPNKRAEGRNNPMEKSRVDPLNPVTADVIRAAPGERLHKTHKAPPEAAEKAAHATNVKPAVRKSAPPETPEAFFERRSNTRAPMSAPTEPRAMRNPVSNQTASRNTYRPDRALPNMRSATTPLRSPASSNRGGDRAPLSTASNQANTGSRAESIDLTGDATTDDDIRPAPTTNQKKRRRSVPDFSKMTDGAFDLPPKQTKALMKSQKSRKGSSHSPVKFPASGSQGFRFPPQLPFEISSQYETISEEDEDGVQEDKEVFDLSFLSESGSSDTA